MMKKLLKSMFANNASVIQHDAAKSRDDDFFGEKSHEYSPAQSGMEVEELSFEDYIRVMKTQEKTILLS
jgi:hypothetical protein